MRQVESNWGQSKSAAGQGRVVKRVENPPRKERDEWENITRIIYPDNSWVEYEYERTYNRRIRANRMGVTTTYA